MESEKKPEAGAVTHPGIAIVAKRIDSVAERVSAEIAARQRSLKIGLAIGLGIAILLAAYLGWLFNEYTEFLAEDELAELLSGTIQQQLPDAEQYLKQHLIREMPGLADGTVASLLNYMPKLRQEIETNANGMAKDFLESLDPEIGKLVDQVLKDHKKDIEEVLSEMAREKDPKVLASAIQNEAERLLEKRVGDELRQFADILVDIERKLKVLRDTKALTEDEELQRDLIIYCKMWVDRNWGALQK